MRRLLCLYVMLSLFCVVTAQDIKDQLRLLIEDYVSQNEDSNEDVELLYETLYELYENPIDINTTTVEELNQLPILTPHQINAIIDYVKKHGEIHNIYELQGVYGLNRKSIENIAPFIAFSQPKEDAYKRRLYLKNEILIRSITVIEDQLGYTRPDSLTHYAGPPYSALLKYKGSLGKPFSWHISAEQDRGEAWFQHATITDFLSYGVEYENDGILHNVVIGDYRMCFGQGLVVNNNFGYGKSSQVMDIIQKGQKLRRSTSSAEFGIMRGGAAHLKFGSVNIVVGASSRLADASLDSTENGVVIRSFTETGLHRTASEIEKYKAARINDAITHLDYTYHNLQLGATFSAQHLSHLYHAEERWDNYYKPHYQNYYNASIDYKWNFRNLMLFGELATDKQGGWAGIQGITAYPSSRVGLSLIYRNYSKDYFAFYGQAFGEGSSVNNEEGLYVGTNILIAKGWSVDCYLDCYRFPWLRYGISRPTGGYDFLIQPNFSPTRKTSMYWRCKYEEKEDNETGDLPLDNIINTQRLELRYHLSTQVSDHIYLQSRIATTHVLHLKDENGYLIYQDVKAKMLKDKLSVTLRYALFNTSSYESRIYTYESDVLYYSYIPSFYGKGCRTYLNTSYMLNENTTFYLKLSYGNNFDGRTMGSSLDAINSTHKTDVHFQVRLKL